MAFQMTSRVVSKMEHAGNTRNGNGRYRVTLDDGVVLLTKPDTHVAVGLYEGALVGDTVKIDLDGRGNIVDIKKETVSA